MAGGDNNGATGDQLATGPDGLEHGLVTSGAPPGTYDSAAVKPERTVPWKSIAFGVVAVAGVLAAVFLLLPDDNGNNPSGSPSGPECKKDSLKADILWILDESGSVGGTNYANLKNSIIEFTSNFNIGPQTTRFGLMEFSNNIPEDGTNRASVINFDQGDSKSEWDTRVSNLVFHGGQTNIAGVLNYAKETFFQKAVNQRSKLDDLFIIFVGDGFPTLPFCYNETTWAGSFEACEQPEANCLDAPFGVDEFSNPCVNEYFPKHTTDAARIELDSLRSTIYRSFKFYFLAIEGQINNNSTQLSTGIFGPLSGPHLKSGDKVFSTFFSELSDFLTVQFDLDCS